MTGSVDKRPAQEGLPPPDPKREAPEPVPQGLLDDVRALLEQRYAGALEPGEGIRVEATTGEGAAWVRARVGTQARVHEIELFAREVPGEGFDGALGLLLDYLDGVLDELFEAARDAYLPLDFVVRRFDDHVLFARSELRDLEAEAAADALLEGRDKATD